LKTSTLSRLQAASTPEPPTHWQQFFLFLGWTLTLIGCTIALLAFWTGSSEIALPMLVMAIAACVTLSLVLPVWQENA